MAFKALVKWNDEQEADLLEWQGKWAGLSSVMRAALLPLLDVVVPEPKWIPKRGDIVTVHRRIHGAVRYELVVFVIASVVHTTNTAGITTKWPISEYTFEPWRANDE